MTLEQAKSAIVEYRLRPRYAETDQMGVIYYANYLVWFECARTEWLRQRGDSYAAIERGGVRLPVRECRIIYHRPARYDRLTSVRASVTDLTPARIAFAYEVFDDDTGQRLAEGMTMHAFVNEHGRIVRRGYEVLGIDA